MKECSRLAQDAVRDGMCVVIGLQSTGEANTSSERGIKGDELDDFVSVRLKSLMGDSTTSCSASFRCALL